MVLARVRNAKLEDIHAGVVPVTNTGDYSDVTVTDGDGRQVPWNDLSHFDDDAMRDLMCSWRDPRHCRQFWTTPPACSPSATR